MKEHKCWSSYAIIIFVDNPFSCIAFVKKPFAPKPTITKEGKMQRKEKNVSLDTNHIQLGFCDGGSLIVIMLCH